LAEAVAVALAVTPQNDDNRGIVDNGNDDANDDRIKCDLPDNFEVRVRNGSYSRFAGVYENGDNSNDDHEDEDPMRLPLRCFRRGRRTKEIFENRILDGVNLVFSSGKSYLVLCVCFVIFSIQ